MKVVPGGAMVMAMVVLGAASAWGQRGHWTVELASGMEARHVILEELRNDSLVVYRDRMREAFPIDSIVEMRKGRSFLALPGAVVGALGLGALGGGISTGSGHSDSNPFLGGVAGGVIGAGFGALLGSALTPDEVYPFTGMDRAGRRSAIETLVMLER